MMMDGLKPMGCGIGVETPPDLKQVAGGTPATVVDIIDL